MSIISTAATQQKFTNLRKRLDQLGYKQPLGIESLPLVEKLFSDLVHTTESLKKSKLQGGKSKNEKGSIDLVVEPYKSDNAKLVKENNELHKQLIKTTEENEVATKDLKASLRKLEHENADLRFLNNQYVHKIRALEQECKKRSDRILSLQEKNFHAVVQTPGGKQKNIPFRRQRMEIDTPVPPAEPNIVDKQLDDPYVADLLQVADEKIAQLSRSNNVLVDEKKASEGKIDMFRKQVDTRDREIDRLTNLLEGGRPYDVVALETRNRSNERLISHLNIQIDYLQQKNTDLQQQLDGALGKLRSAADTTISLDTRNTELERELQDVDRMAQRIELDKSTALRIADKELVEAKIELEKSRKELEDLDLQVSQFKAEKERLIGDIENSKYNITSEKADRQRLEDLLDKVQEDKRRLSHRVNKLTANEKELVLEIDRLKHKNGMAKKNSKSSHSIETFIKGLEEERDYWKSEVDTLQQLMRHSRHSADSTRSSSPTRSRKGTPKPKSRSSSPALIKGTKSAKGSTSGSTVAQLETKICKLEDERDCFKRELDIMKSMRSVGSTPARSKSPLRQSSECDPEFMKVQRERDELQGLLDKFERHMAEIQANVKVLTNERDKINCMYEEAREEITCLRQQMVRSPKSPKTSLAAQAVLRRVEVERDDAISELRRMTTERDSLRERLKIATETSLADRARLEQRLEDLENSCHYAESERNELSCRSGTLEKLAGSLEDQLREQSIVIQSTKDEAAQHMSTAAQMRVLADQAERSCCDVKERLNKREDDLRKAQEEIRCMAREMEDARRGNHRDCSKIQQLQDTVAALDREKDHLQAHIDEKTEREVLLQSQVGSKDKDINELRCKCQEYERALDCQEDQVCATDREIQSMRRQLDRVNEELTEMGRARDVALRENRRLQEDLATMTRETQSLNNELQDSIEEKECLKNQVQDYLTEVKRVEELMAAKEQERGDLLEQYRILSLEAEKYETQTHQLESEGSNLRLEIMTKESELRRVKERIDQMERDLHEHAHGNRAYENQVSSLTRTVANLEESLRQCEKEKCGFVQDLSAVRDLCARLEASKDVLQRELTCKTLDQEKLQNVLDEMQHDTEILRSQVTSERTSVKSLEGLLKSNREKEFHVQMSQQEREAELQLLKDRLCLNESKLESMVRELTAVRTRNIELESECDRMKRNYTNERFERERAVQELKRNRISMPGESSVRSPTRYRSPSPHSRSRSPYRHDDADDAITSLHNMKASSPLGRKRRQESLRTQGAKSNNI